jgi:hypothetical protein
VGNIAATSTVAEIEAKIRKESELVSALIEAGSFQIEE